jgi:hypothetical protein
LHDHFVNRGGQQRGTHRLAKLALHFGAQVIGLWTTAISLDCRNQSGVP